MSAILGDQLFVDPAWDQAQALAGENDNDRKVDRVYLYRCRAEVDCMTKAAVPVGACHTTELPLVFNVSSMWATDSKEARSAASFSTAWASFAISGNPGELLRPRFGLGRHFR